MFPLRQSTASQEVELGPFTDSVDGNTHETALLIANTDIRLFKFGASASVAKNSGGATATEFGKYVTTLDATDTATAGPMVIDCHPTGAGPFKLYCDVLPPNVYDARYGADLLQVDVKEVNGTSQTAADLASLEYGGTLIASDVSDEELSTTTTIFGGNLPAVTSEIPAGSLVRVTRSEQHYYRRCTGWDGDFTITVDTALPFVPTATDRVDIFAQPPQLETINTKIGTPAGASVSADIAAAKADTAAILVDTGTTLPDQIGDIEGGGGGGGTPLDMAGEPVPTSRTFVLVETSTGWRNERVKRINRSDSAAAYSVDFRNLASANQKAYTVGELEFIEGDDSDITISDGEDWERDGGTEYHFSLTPSTVGEYRVRIPATLINPGGSVSGDIVFEVV